MPYFDLLGYNPGDIVFDPEYAPEDLMPDAPPDYFDLDALVESIAWQLAKDGGMPEPTSATYATAHEIAERMRYGTQPFGA